MTDDEQQAIRFLVTAFASPHGIALVTPNPERYRQFLYRVRKAQGDPDLMALSIETVLDEPSVLFIVKRPRLDDVPVE